MYEHQSVLKKTISITILKKNIVRPSYRLPMPSGRSRGICVRTISAICRVRQPERRTIMGAGRYDVFVVRLVDTRKRDRVP